MIVWGSTFAAVRPAVESLLRRVSPETDVVVLDIDATLLRNDDEATPCRGTAVEAGRHVYELARDRGLEIHLVTARLDRADVRRFTERQLRCLGYDVHRSLSMRRPEVRSGPAISRFKRRARRGVSNRTGKRVALNVGDQWFDVVRYDSAAQREALRGATTAMPFVLFSSGAERHRVRWHLKLPSEA